jgi:methionine-rich copper-binding protein CopC
MKTKVVLAAVLLLFAAAAQAHTHLKESVPKEGSTVPVSPPNIVLKFSEAARLTALTVKKADGAEQKLAPLPSSAATEVTVRAPDLAPGKYVLSWRAVSADSHVMSGEVHFTIAEKGAGAG